MCIDAYREWVSYICMLGGMLKGGVGGGGSVDSEARGRGRNGTGSTVIKWTYIFKKGSAQGNGSFG